MTGVGIGKTRPSEICGWRNLPCTIDRAVQVEQVELLGVGVDLGLDDLRHQRGLALHVQDGLLGVEQGTVESDGAVVEVEPAHRALDGNAMVAGDVEDERVEDLQAGQAHHQARDRAAAQRRRDMAVGRSP